MFGIDGMYVLLFWPTLLCFPVLKTEQIECIYPDFSRICFYYSISCLFYFYSYLFQNFPGSHKNRQVSRKERIKHYKDV